MNIVIFSHDLPWPTNHGGRIDMYNRLKAFKELNHRVFFVCWALFDDNKSEDSIEHMRDIVDELVFFSRKEDFFNRILDISEKLVKLTVQPNLVTQCSLKKKPFRILKDRIEKFKADVIFAENIYAAGLAYKYAALMNLPFFIRTHNIEHIYVKKLVALSDSLKVRLKFLAMSANLEKYERNMLQKADVFFDISLSDLKYWEQQGFKKGHWMPTVYYPNNNINPTTESNGLQFDIAYIGNLNSPNNLHGIFWFLEAIFPGIQKRYPGVTILIAGSKPAKSLSDFCLNKSNITLLPNPKDVHALYLQSKVLINPICFGSGVNIKTIEMLHLNKPIVCTPKAIEGLPKELETVFKIAKDASEFVFEVLKCLQDEDLPVSRDQVLSYFSPSYLIGNIHLMEKICANNKGTS